MSKFSKFFYYILLYLRPTFFGLTYIVGFIIGLLGTVGVGVTMLKLMEFHMSFLILSIVCLIIPFALFLLRRFYDQLLFKLSPPDHDLILDVQ